MVHAILVDTCTLVSFAAAGRLDLLQLALEGRGRWTDAAAHETGRAADDWPALRSLHVAGDLAMKRGIEVSWSMTVLSQAYFDGHSDCPAAYAVLLDMRHVDRGVYVPGNHQSVCPS